MKGKSGIFALLTTAAALTGYAQTPNTVIRPVEIQDVLVNPGMGVTTFNRFNGQELNPPTSGRSAARRRCFRMRIRSRTFRTLPLLTCAGTGRLSSRRGTIRWDIIDSALAEAEKHGQRLAIRIMPYAGQEGSIEPLPAWYRNSGARRANKPTDKDGEVWQPDFSDPLYLKYWGELVAAAGEDTTAIPTWTASTYRRLATGARVGVSTCLNLNTRSRLSTSG